MSSVVDVVEEIRTSIPEEMVSSETERIGSPSIGDVVRQGDLYLTCVETLPEGKTTKNRQLVPGNTQGSRHIIEGDVEIVTNVDIGIHKVLTGPAFKCNGDAELTHPEHGNKILPAGTIWQSHHQQVYADHVRRVQD